MSQHQSSPDLVVGAVIEVVEVEQKTETQAAKPKEKTEGGKEAGNEGRTSRKARGLRRGERRLERWKYVVA